MEYTLATWKLPRTSRHFEVYPWYILEFSIKGVLTSAKGVVLNHPKTDVPHHLYIPAEDHDRFDISVYFDQAADWIRERLEESNILVHCLAGVSRSVSLVLAYLMKHKNMGFDDAFYMVKSKRKIVINSLNLDPPERRIQETTQRLSKKTRKSTATVLWV